MARILVIDADAQVRRFLLVTLKAHGYEATGAQSTAEGMRSVASQSFHLVVVDPREGVMTLNAIREESDVPIVVVSAGNEESLKVEALDHGARDYIVKPFGTAELMARVRAALRHKPKICGDDILHVGPLTIDIPNRLVLKHGEPVRLSRREFDLLAALAASPDHVLSHRAISEAAWGPERAADVGYLRVFMGQLRKKLEDTPSHPRIIVSEPGIGYRLKMR
jgi:two-component system, OmpR family, KDP operon response regulator KdpE